MEVTIKVEQGDLKRIIHLGLIPWTSITQDERSEWEGFANYYGAMLLKAAIKSA